MNAPVTEMHQRNTVSNRSRNRLGGLFLKLAHRLLFDQRVFDELKSDQSVVRISSDSFRDRKLTLLRFIYSVMHVLPPNIPIETAFPTEVGYVDCELSVDLNGAIYVSIDGGFGANDNDDNSNESKTEHPPKSTINDIAEVLTKTPSQRSVLLGNYTNPSLEDIGTACDGCPGYTKCWNNMSRVEEVVMVILDHPGASWPDRIRAAMDRVNEAGVTILPDDEPDGMRMFMVSTEINRFMDAVVDEAVNGHPDLREHKEIRVLMLISSMIRRTIQQHDEIMSKPSYYDYVMAPAAEFMLQSYAYGLRYILKLMDDGMVPNSRAGSVRRAISGLEEIARQLLEHNRRILMGDQ